MQWLQCTSLAFKFNPAHISIAGVSTRLRVVTLSKNLKSIQKSIPIIQPAIEGAQLTYCKNLSPISSMVLVGNFAVFILIFRETIEKSDTFFYYNLLLIQEFLPNFFSFSFYKKYSGGFIKKKLI